LLTVFRSFMNVANSVLWRMAIILKANKVNLFVFWYHSLNVLDTPRKNQTGKSDTWSKEEAANWMNIMNILSCTYLDWYVSVTCYSAHLLHTNITLKYQLCVGIVTIAYRNHGWHVEMRSRTKNTDFFFQTQTFSLFSKGYPVVFMHNIKMK
jgi:hypothetical protein